MPIDEMFLNALPFLIFTSIIGLLAYLLFRGSLAANKKSIAKDKKIEDLEARLTKAESELTSANAKLANRTGHDASDITEHFTTLQRFFGAGAVPATIRDATRLVEKYEAADEGQLEHIMIDKSIRKDVMDKRAAGEKITNIRHYMPSIVARFQIQRSAYNIQAAQKIVAEQKGTTILEENTRLVTENAALNQSLTNMVTTQAQLMEKIRVVMLKVAEIEGKPQAAALARSLGINEGVLQEQAVRANVFKFPSGVSVADKKADDQAKKEEQAKKDEETDPDNAAKGGKTGTDK